MVTYADDFRRSGGRPPMPEHGFPNTPPRRRASDDPIQAGLEAAARLAAIGRAGPVYPADFVRAVDAEVHRRADGDLTRFLTNPVSDLFPRAGRRGPVTFREQLELVTRGFVRRVAWAWQVLVTGDCGCDTDD